ncbi:hypothetical protein A6A08_02470 [Nocardiopsis sp. TSRI0078]|uniref:hypothetical protein n=1 Tax=Nocardiopsis sp. TSRI0078 TaxID=1718951 RepID=UPI000938BA73|nr:hypothetical protein [Nocardiopsis sp. TSRI0078]OKI23651.1 hypothetical protein A6A08_02470 [Nocardiopsis sp. TSRI0078]
MLLPALVARSYGDLTSDQVRWLHDKLQLDEGTPRTEGIGAAASIAHRTFTDGTADNLVLELGRTGEDGWLFSVYFEKGGRPSTETVESYRRLFRDLIDQLGLRLREIIPAATADEVAVAPPQPPNVEGGVGGVAWQFSYTELDQLWAHLGLLRDAPREVKAVKLREFMTYPFWSAAPEPLRSQAEEFLRET